VSIFTGVVLWWAQPVPKIGEEVVECGPLVKQTVEEIRKEPYPLAAGMEWSLIDINDPAQSKEVYTLLTENYVEDDDNMFRFDYSVNPHSSCASLI
jgi:glycylpeptide N-tetradecanoyltransferase